ncbi:MAG: efflux RND transporter permease subunit [Verrucomicrobia bacterium]|nr:efflux RND transporter permease subunit [Verrucomicrobiota bacterium]MCH8527656.1 efflux RND transporter permease subunit [Kiritimatiellia bacterium]
MNLPKFSVHHPIFATMVTLMVIVLGATSLSRLRIDLLPEIETTTLSIRTEYTGASPEVVERLITQFIEEIASSVPGVEEITSVSSEGSSIVTVRFTWGTNVDSAAIDMQSAIENGLRRLPDDVRPRIFKFDINQFPVVLLGVASDMDPVDLTTLIEDELRVRFSRVPGVAQVDIWGGFNREIRIELLPERIKSLGISLNQIRQTLLNANIDLPAGRIEQGLFESTLRAPAQFTNLDEIRNTVVTWQDGAPVLLSQVADVRDTYEELRRIIRINNETGVRLAIRKQPEANTVEVAQGVFDEIDRMNRDYPQIDVVPVIDQGNFIERSIANVTRSVFYGGGLAIVVLLVFLRNIRSTVVIALSIPISVIATFALIYFGGFTLNLMTLGGLALGVGMMVDSSVVVLENIFRRQDEDNEDPETASINGANEVAAAIVASTLTTLVIFLPMAFIQGIAGILFQELALVVVFALICSLLVSLSLVPVLASKLLTSPEHRHEARKPWMDRLATRIENQFKEVDRQYRDLLLTVLKKPWWTVAAAMLLLFSSTFLLQFIGNEFLPPSDEGEVRISGEMEVGTRLALVDELSRRVERIVVDAVPEKTAWVTSIGASRRGGSFSRMDMRLSLTPAMERDRSNIDIANALRRELDGAVPGMTVRTRAPQGQFLLNRLLGGEEGFTVEVRGFDLLRLDQIANDFAERMRDIPGITDVQLSSDIGLPQQEVRIDRDKASALGFQPGDVARFLETTMAGTPAGDFQVDGNSFRILMRLKDAERLTPEDILDLTLTNPAGRQVALRNLVTLDSGTGPLLIQRKEQQRYIEVNANITGRDTGSIARDVQEIISDTVLPEGYALRIAGNYEEQQRSRNELLLSLGLALLFVYMVLACQYESLINPVIVMAAVPMAAIGVLVTLFLTNTTLNLQSYIGCIMLAGIVVNNAILLVDQSSQLVKQGLSVHDAVAEAGRRRLRPILMTTLTTILALIPLALGIGEGADAQAPLARAVVGGLAGATLITLLLIPVVFTLFHPDPPPKS